MNPSLRVRAAYAACALLLPLAGCSDDAAKPRAGATPSPAIGDSAAGSPAPGRSAGASAVPTTTAVPAPGTTTTGLPSRTDPTPVSTAAPGPQARRLQAAPGHYVLDMSGTSRYGANPERRDSAEVRMTVDPAVGEDQHSTQEAGQYGGTDQTVRFTSKAIQLVQIKLTAPGYVKEFRPVRPVLLLPQPPERGRKWSWTVVSTDGATSLSVDAEIVRTETVVIGGERVVCTVVHATLRLTGDFTATSVMDTWYSDRYHLAVKDHTVIDGQFGAFTFHSDTTTTLRSTKPADT